MAFPASLSNLAGQARALPAGRRLALALTGAASLAFFLWLALGSATADYRLLYRGLAEDEAGRVIDALQAEKIPHRLAEGGSAILVPAAQVYDARIRVARKGLPSGGGSGFELFDRPGFGVTDFVNRVNYQRALQGELARGIEQLEAVERARVQLALPQRSAFAGRESEKPSASVVVRLRPTQELSSEQVRAIGHLVASSVEGLSASAVSIVDHGGRLLSAQGEELPGPAAPAAALTQEARLERELAQRIESILERPVGVGGVTARVRAEMDWTQTETTEERFDPDSQVARSEQRATESSSDSQGGARGGVPGVVSNSPETLGQTSESPGSASSSARSTETVNYEISKTVSRQVLPVGAVRRLTVAVLVDAKPAAPGAADPAPTPWSDSELKQFEELAKQAIGFSQERGDRFTLTSAPFRSFALEEEPQGWLGPDVLVLASTAVRSLAGIALLVLFAQLVVRPLVSAFSAREPAVAGSAAGPAAASSGAARVEMELARPSATLATPAATPAVAAAAARAPELLGAGRARSDEGVKAIRAWMNQR